MYDHVKYEGDHYRYVMVIEGKDPIPYVSLEMAQHDAAIYEARGWIVKIVALTT